jgi:hypothetical protein
MSNKYVELSDYFGIEFHNFCVFIKYSLYAVFVFLKIDTEMMTTLSTLMLMDTFLGVVKVIALNYQFSFKKLLWGFTTKFLILLIPMIVALIGKGVDQDFLWAIEFTMKILIVNEGLSCLTNILSAKTKVEIQNVDLVTTLLNYLRNILIMISKKIFGAEISESIKEATNNKKQDQ